MTKKTKLIAYKGFSADLVCRDFQYEIGKTYTHDGKVKACNSGFHACEHPLDVFSYYAPASSRFALVEMSGDTDRDGGDTKIASAEITIKAELKIPDLVAKAWDYVWSRAKIEDGEHSTGNRGAASSTGYQGAASSTGDYGAASSTGNRGAASSTGKASVAMSSGFAGKAKASEGSAIFLTERDLDWNIVAVFAGIAGKDGIKSDTWYRLENGKPVEVGE